VRSSRSGLSVIRRSHASGLPPHPPPAQTQSQETRALSQPPPPPPQPLQLPLPSRPEMRQIQKRYARINYARRVIHHM